jgi:colanic acid/amylovoran biosynthesis glycosyltransferase
MSEVVKDPRQARVLIFRSALLPISETFIREQAEALRRFRPVYAGLTGNLSGLPDSSHSILLTHPGGRSAQLAKHLYRLSGYGPSFKAKAKEARPDLIHAHFALDGIEALPLARHLGIPLVVSLHGYDVTTDDGGLRRSIPGFFYLLRRRQLWDQADMFLCVSEFIRSKAIEAGFPKEKLRVHYTGVNCDTFRPSSQEREEVVLFVGRLVQKKGCAYLLDAMAQVCVTNPSTRLIVIGDGPLRSELQAQAARLNVPVDFLGSQPPAEVRGWMSRASVFCVPSLEAENGDSEGFGMVFAEAQAMGTPVVSFQHGGLPEAVDDGVTGLLVPERDTAALAGAIKRLLGDPELWRRFSERGAARIRESFSLDRQTQLLEDIYQSVL